MNALSSLFAQILYIPKLSWKMGGKCTINAVSCFLGHAVSISMAIWKVHECKALLNTLKINTEETIEAHLFLFYSMSVLLSFAWPDVAEFQICSTVAVNKIILLSLKLKKTYTFILEDVIFFNKWNKDAVYPLLVPILIVSNSHKALHVCCLNRICTIIYNSECPVLTQRYCSCSFTLLFFFFWTNTCSR